MSQTLYMHDVTHAQVNVLKCERSPEGFFVVELDQTPFHPQGGGQPSDVGKVGGVDVEHVFFQDQKIIHRCSTELSLGPVNAEVNVAHRHYFSRLHSAGHLIGHVLQAKGWLPVKAQHWPNDAKVQFVSTAEAQEVDLSMIEALCNQYIQNDLARVITQNESGYRQVGFGDFSAFPCGGTHVKSLSDIIQILITELKLKKSKLSIKYQVAEAALSC